MKVIKSDGLVTASLSIGGPYHNHWDLKKPREIVNVIKKSMVMPTVPYLRILKVSMTQQKKL